jgi:hypothetical protein
MKIIITAGEAIDIGIWEELCNIKGMWVFALNEGVIDNDHEVILTEEEASKLGIINK